MNRSHIQRLLSGRVYYTIGGYKKRHEEILRGAKSAVAVSRTGKQAVLHGSHYKEAVRVSHFTQHENIDAEERKF